MMPQPSLAILLESGRHDRAHYAFVLASGAAALGRSVVLFATNRGCQALMTDWSGLEDAARDARLRAVGVAGLDELRDAARELGITLIVCDAGMRSEGFDAGSLMDGVRVAGIATFLEKAADGQMVAL